MATPLSSDDRFPHSIAGQAEREADEAQDRIQTGEPAHPPDLPDFSAAQTSSRPEQNEDAYRRLREAQQSGDPRAIGAAHIRFELALAVAGWSSLAAAARTVAKVTVEPESGVPSPMPLPMPTPTSVGVGARTEGGMFATKGVKSAAESGTSGTEGGTSAIEGGTSTAGGGTSEAEGGKSEPPAGRGPSIRIPGRARRRIRVGRWDTHVGRAEQE